jgi:hypothetical protein
MSKARTPDERYIVYLYQTAKALGDWETPQDRYEVGKAVGISTRGVNAISTLLAQSNFIKKVNKGDDVMIHITERGIALAERILDN